MVGEVYITSTAETHTPSEWPRFREPLNIIEASMLRAEIKAKGHEPQVLSTQTDLPLPCVLRWMNVGTEGEWALFKKNSGDPGWYVYGVRAEP